MSPFSSITGTRVREMCTRNVTLHPQSSSSFSGFQQLFNSAHKLLMVGIAHLFNLCYFLRRESVKSFRELATSFVVQDVSKYGRKDSINSVRSRCRRIRKGHNLPNVILEVDVGHQQCLLSPAHCGGELFGERVEIWQTIVGNLDVTYLAFSLVPSLFKPRRVEAPANEAPMSQ